MANWLQDNCVITNEGLAMLAKAQVGLGTLEITKIVSRDVVSTPEENKLLTGDSTTLSYKQEAVLLGAKAGILLPEDTQNADVSQITARFSNEKIGAGMSHKIRQIIVFMRLTELVDESDDMGEVPYMVAQSEGEDDFDFMPEFSANPTAINYDLYIIHSGVAQIDISVKTAGYVDEQVYEEDLKAIRSSISKINTSNVGQNTEGITFDVWTPEYSADDAQSGGRVWSKGDSLKIAGDKTSERFNNYNENNNIVVNTSSHVEGINNSSNSASAHIEGVENCTSDSLAPHVEGEHNFAAIGWIQHIEGTTNQGYGYLAHIEGQQNLVNAEASVAHVEGKWNTVKSGDQNHISGYKNLINSGDNIHISGANNIVSGSVCSTVSGYGNNVSVSAYSTVSGHENTVTSAYDSAVFGAGNSAVNSGFTFIAGKNNKAIMSCDGSILTGIGNDVNDCLYVAVSGNDNTVSTTSTSSLVAGGGNTVTSSERSIIVGSENKTTNSDNIALFGQRNTVIDSNENIISGYENSVTGGTIRSIISGTNNSFTKDASREQSFGMVDSLLVGESNTVTRVECSLIAGKNQVFHDVIDNGVSRYGTMLANILGGESNIFRGVYSSVVAGRSNVIENIHDSIILGKDNNVSYKGLNASWDHEQGLICVGNSNTVIDSQDKPKGAFGYGNNVSGDFSYAFGQGLMVASANQVVTGKFNVVDSSNKYAFIVGGGTDTARSNIFTVDWNGNACIKSLYVGKIYDESGTKQLNTWNISDGASEGSLLLNDISSNTSTGLHSIAAGSETQATKDYAVALGVGTKSSALATLATGRECESNSDYSFTSGYMSKVNSPQAQAMGYTNIVSTGSSAAFVCGSNNSVENSSASFTSGNNNKNKASYAFIAGGSGNTNTGISSFVTGQNNNNSGLNAFVAGINNTVTSKYYVFGEGNTLSVSSQTPSFVTGNSHTARNGILLNTFISGNGNSVDGASNCDTIMGNYNTVTATKCNLISGHNNTVDGSYLPATYNVAKGNVLSGNNNTAKCGESLIVGENNYVSGCNNIVGGAFNTLGSVENPDSANLAVNNIVSGFANLCTGDGNLMIGSGLIDCAEYLADDPLMIVPGVTTVWGNRAYLGQFNSNGDNEVSRDVVKVGWGSAEDDRRTIFSVTTSGGVLATGSFDTQGSDIAEWFEWKDGNTLKEDRRGLFVTLDGDKIALADENTNFVIGIVSARPSLVGNSYENEWNQRYLTDVFGEVLYEDYIVEAKTKVVINDKGEEETIIISPERMEKRPIVNPDYDPNQKYVPRSERPEWSFVSCVGRLVMVDDGTCKVNGFCRPKSGGIATASDTGYRVMKRIDETHILVWTEGARYFE